MKMNRKTWKKISGEWELLALGVTTSLVIVAIMAWVWGGHGAHDAGAPPRQLPVKASRINHKTAYALLSIDIQSGLSTQHLFASGLEWRSAQGSSAESKPKPKPKPEPTPAVTVVPTPAVVEPPPAPVPVVEPVPEVTVHMMSYEGFQTRPTGQHVAILKNHTTGERIILAEGQKFHGYLISKFTQLELELLSPRGRTTKLPAGREFPVPAAP